MYLVPQCLQRATSLGSWHEQRSQGCWSREWGQDLTLWFPARTEGFCGYRSNWQPGFWWSDLSKLWSCAWATASKVTQGIQCLVGPVTCFSSALLSRTDLPRASQEARILSVATNMSLSQGMDCKTLFILIFTNCYWWLICTCFKCCWARHLFALLFMWSPQSVAGAAEFRKAIEKKPSDVHRKEEFGRGKLRF